MIGAARFSAAGVTPIVDPTSGSGDIYLLPEGMGQDGRPFVFMVDDPPCKTRPRHYHHGDVLYVYVSGEHHIEGEGTYRAGDLRWARGGHAYGPETTGAEGGAWWVISYSDPLPVNVEEHDAAAPATPAARVSGVGLELPEFAAPYDWAAIDGAVRTAGGAILKRLLDTAQVAALNHDIDIYLERHPRSGAPASGSATYDMFLGHRTLRLHGLVEKIAAAAGLIGHPELVRWAERLIAGKAASVLLNAGELIQIGPGEPAQYLHRDSDSWPALPIDSVPAVVNAIIALDPFTLANGATYIAPSSWQWDRHRQPRREEFARAVMDAGDAVLFRGDLLHGGGENNTQAPRRAISVSYCAGWLRTVENSFLNVPKETVRRLSPQLQALLGYAAHNAVTSRGGMLGLQENADPRAALSASADAR